MSELPTDLDSGQEPLHGTLEPSPLGVYSPGDEALPPSDVEAPPLPEGKVRLDAGSVLAAVTRLRTTLATTRADVLTKWLARKVFGLSASTPASYTSADCARFARDWYEIPGTEPSVRYFNPFDSAPERAWFGDRLPTADRGGTQWHMQTLWTQLDRPAQLERTLYGEGSRVESAPDDPPRSVRRQQPVRDATTYVEDLATVFAGEQKPLLEDLAIWRYRFEVFDAGVTVADLVTRLRDELHLSPEEEAAVFATPTAEPADG